MTLLSIEEEAEACRSRCAGMKIGDICLHVHHEIFAEPLTEPIENRIRYILSDKPVAEQALRLRMMGPPIIDDQVQADEADAAYQKASPAWLKASAELDKADATWQKAEATWQKASVERQKTCATGQQAEAERQKAYAVWQKAYVERLEASDAWLKTEAELEKAVAVWQKAYKRHYARLYPESPWNGYTIFAGPFSKERKCPPSP